MCGIAGILNKGVSNSLGSMTSQLRKMLNAMRHRGPDDRGENIIRDANGHTLYLGHQRLSIIEPGPGGHQPMSNDDSTVWISTNSEIYNYQDLKKIKYPIVLLSPACSSLDEWKDFEDRGNSFINFVKQI